MTQNPFHRAVLLGALVSTALLRPAVAAPGHDHSHDEPKPGKAAAKHDNHDHAGHDPGPDDHDHEAHADEVKLSDSAIRQNNVRVGKAEAKKLMASVIASARVAYDAEAIAHVGSFVSGRIVELKAKVGDSVKKGDALLVVESPDIGKTQSEFLQRRTEALIAEAAISPAKEAFSRAKKLFDESQGIAYAEVLKREAEHRAAAGAAANARAALQATENTLRLYGFGSDAIAKLTETGEIDPRFVIRAAIAGRVIEREVTIGELVSPDKEKLFVIANTDTLWLLADVPETRLADIDVGSKVTVQLAAVAGEPIIGEVSLISPEVDPITRTARARIVVANSTGRIRYGMFAKATIEAGDPNSTQLSVVVPEQAVQNVEGKPGVFVPVEGEANTFARREVVVGKPVNGFVPVMSGLKADEAVVISGSFILKAELGKSEAGHSH